MVSFSYHLPQRETLFLFSIFWTVSFFGGFLLFGNYGFYNDDWTAVGGFFKYELFNIDSPLEWFQRWPHGRPLGWFFLQVLGAPGRYFMSLPTHYLVAISIIAATCYLSFRLVEKRFGVTTACAVVCCFVLSPVNTTHISLTMVFICYPGIILALTAMIMYTSQANIIRRLSYMLAFLALPVYESTFFLFLAAPWFAKPIRQPGTVQTTIKHIFICAILVAAYLTFRLYVFEVGFTLRSGMGADSAVNRLLYGLFLYPLLFVKLFFETQIFSFQNLDVVALPILISVVLTWNYCLWRGGRSFPIIETNSSHGSRFFDSLLVGLACIVLSVMIAGFSEMYPGFPSDFRGTRIFAFSFLGAGIIFGAFVEFLFKIFSIKQMHMRLLLVAVIFLPMSVRAAAIQNDYVDAWEKQKKVIDNVIAQSCDLAPGDIIVLELSPYNRGRHQAVKAHSFGYATVIADLFDWKNVPLLNRPRMMRAHRDWKEFVTVDKNNTVNFKKQVLLGIPLLANRPVEAGKIIVFRQLDWAQIKRASEPIVINGVTINKMQGNELLEDCFWNRFPQTGPLAVSALRTNIKESQKSGWQ